MEAHTIRTLIRQKLADGRLPHGGIPRVWGGPGAGETCDGCGEVVTKTQSIMEGVSLEIEKRAVQFHVACFKIWDEERTVPRR